MDFWHFTGPKDWDDERHITVEVNPDGTAVVRNLLKEGMQIFSVPAPEALKRAEVFVLFSPWHTAFGVRLKEGASWDRKWGRLVDGGAPKRRRTPRG